MRFKSMIVRNAGSEDSIGTTVWNWISKRLSMLLVCAVMVLLCSCGSAVDSGTEKENGNGKETVGTKKVSMYDLRMAMLAADDSFPDMMSVSDADESAEDSFAYLSDLAYSKVDHFFMSYATEDGNTEEIAVIAVKDSSDVEVAEESLKAHLESRIKLFDQYEPEKVSELEKGEIFIKDQYAVLIVCKDIEKVKSAFNEFLTGGDE